MRLLTERYVALVAMLAVLLGLLVPAVAAPCVEARAGAAHDTLCPCCDAALPVASTACALACQPGMPTDRAAQHPPREIGVAWFAMAALAFFGIEQVPATPPPR